MAYPRILRAGSSLASGIAGPGARRAGGLTEQGGLYGLAPAAAGWTGTGLAPRMLSGPAGCRAGRRRCQSGAAMNSPGVFADLAAQRACWHPVAFAGEVADRPVHADLLGEPLVIWRGAGWAPRAMSDLCVHRGTALSLGSVQGEIGRAHV